MTDILLPRSVVEALVTALLNRGEHYTECTVCDAVCSLDETPDHAPACPVRIAQEALAQPQQTLTPDEHYSLRSMVITWIDEGFTRPPYDAEVYGILQKLGITQADLTQGYDITPPPDTSTRT